MRRSKLPPGTIVHRLVPTCTYKTDVQGSYLWP